MLRLRKGAHNKRLRRCGNCGQMASHNARSCRAQPCDTVEATRSQARNQNPARNRDQPRARGARRLETPEPERRARRRQLQREIDEQVIHSYDDEFPVPASTIGPGWWLEDQSSELSSVHGFTDASEGDDQMQEIGSTIVVEPRIRVQEH